MQFPFKIEDLFDFVRQLYYWIRNVIQWLLESTIIKANPKLATQFADVIVLLSSLTAILLILEFVSGAKKVLAVIVALGWVFLITSIVIAVA